MNIKKLILFAITALGLIAGSLLQARHHHRHHHRHSNFGISVNMGRPAVLVQQYPVYCYRPVLVRPQPVVYYASQPRVSFRMGFGSFGMMF